MKKVIIVDANDTIVGYKQYKDIDFKNEIYRVSRLWITDAKNNILLQKRSDQLKIYPGLWGCAAAGTNDQGETYESNIVKEAEEEIGLKIQAPKVLHKRFEHDRGERNIFCTYFAYQIDTVKPAIRFDTQEVASVKWFSFDELKDAIEKSPESFSPDITDILSDFNQ